MDDRALYTNEQLRSEHERLGRIATEIIAAYVASLEDAPVCSRATPEDLLSLFDEPLPREGAPAEEIFDKFKRDVVPHAMNIPSPRYYGLFNPTPLPVAVWADALASAINQNLAAWRNSPSASMVEARVLLWLCELIGYGEGAFGTLTSGGSEANLVGLKCARDRAAREAIDVGVRAAASVKGDLVVYASEQCHYSLVKCVDILGLGRDNLRKIETDERFHIRTDALLRAIQNDLREGRTPVCVAAAAGATSSGVIDPLDELADIAREFNIWFHVDAAYGGALAFSEKFKKRLRGIERADSVTIDPHKWMFAPFACGALLVREGGRVLRDSFDITPEYLSEDRGGSDVEYDFFRYGQLGTRRFNALKIWMSVKRMGVNGYASIIERQLELAEYFAARIDALEDFERVGEVETALCCARFVPEKMRGESADALDSLQKRLQQRVERSGEAWFATTVLHGRRVLRMNVNSFLTTKRHMDDLLESLQREGAKLLQENEAL